MKGRVGSFVDFAIKGVTGFDGIAQDCGRAGNDAHLNESQKVNANTSIYDKMIAGVSTSEGWDEVRSNDLVMA